MQFHIDTDNGGVVAGWLIPDNPGDTPEFIVQIPGEKPVPFRANVLRPDIRDLGLHPTGQVGFMIDDRIIDGLNEQMLLTVFEAETNLPIYRRPLFDRNIEKKLLFIDMGVMPQIKMLRKIMRSFTLGYPMIERFSLETVVAILSNNYVPSLLVAGQPNWQRINGVARERGFATVALLRNPFEELAERLLFLSYLSKRPSTNAASSVFSRHMALASIVEALDHPQDKALLSAFRRLSVEQRRLLRSPMTAAIACTPDEEPQRRNVSVALDQLAQLDLVGVRDHFHPFTSLADEIIGSSVFADVTLESLPGTGELAQKLSEIGIVADILDEDIALHAFTREAVETATGLTEAQRSTCSGGSS